MSAVRQPARDARGTYACLVPPSPDRARPCCTDGRHVSVTTVLGAVLSKPALIQWAANCAADDAREWARAWKSADCDGEDCSCPRVCSAYSHEDVDAARDAWAKAHVRQRDKAAARGSTVHRVVEALVLGRDPAPSDLTPEVLPYLDALRHFCERERPAVAYSECEVSSRHGYAGTLDAIHRTLADDGLVIRDWKTRKSEKQARLYGEEALQLAAYRYATWMRTADGTVRNMPRIGAAEVVLLWPPTSASDPGYRIERVDAGRATHRIFLRCLDIYRWQRRQQEATP